MPHKSKILEFHWISQSHIIGARELKVRSKFGLILSIAYPELNFSKSNINSSWILSFSGNPT